MTPRTGTFRNSSTPSIVPIEVSMDSRTKARTNPSNTPIRELSMRLRVAWGAFLGEPGVTAGSIIETSSMRSAPRIENSWCFCFKLAYKSPFTFTSRSRLANSRAAFGKVMYRSLNRPMPSLTERSEEHTSELQSLAYLVCRLLLEKKKKNEPTYVKMSRARAEHLLQSM